jgi:hypothetical protein
MQIKGVDKSLDVSSLSRQGIETQVSLKPADSPDAAPQILWFNEIKTISTPAGQVRIRRACCNLWNFIV